MSDDMQDHERTQAAQWLREMRGDTSQQAIAADITSRTGWTITRDRYSKYESGSLPFGRAVLQHFVDYWTGLGRPGPDLTPPTPALSLEERAVVAAERQAAASEAMVELMREQNAALLSLLSARQESDDQVASKIAALASVLATPGAAKALQDLGPVRRPRPTQAG